MNSQALKHNEQVLYGVEILHLAWPCCGSVCRKEVGYCSTFLNCIHRNIVLRYLLTDATPNSFRITNNWNLKLPHLFKAKYVGFQCICFLFILIIALCVTLVILRLKWNTKTMYREFDNFLCISLNIPSPLFLGLSWHSILEILLEFRTTRMKCFVTLEFFSLPYSHRFCFAIFHWKARPLDVFAMNGVFNNACEGRYCSTYKFSMRILVLSEPLISYWRSMWS